MIPVTSTMTEIVDQKKIIETVYEKVLAKFGLPKAKLALVVGTMIEIPRACVTADKFAEPCEFFSFGTNDLTQMGFGFSRDDIGGFLPHYLEKKILPADPFQTIDQEGIGELIEMGITKGRAVKPNLKIGICGEHGGEPESVKFCHQGGHELRVLLAVPRAAGQAGRGAGGGGRRGEKNRPAGGQGDREEGRARQEGREKGREEAGEKSRLESGARQEGGEEDRQEGQSPQVNLPDRQARPRRPPGCAGPFFGPRSASDRHTAVPCYPSTPGGSRSSAMTRARSSGRGAATSSSLPWTGWRKRTRSACRPWRGGRVGSSRQPFAA